MVLLRSRRQEAAANVAEASAANANVAAAGGRPERSRRSGGDRGGQSGGDAAAGGAASAMATPKELRHLPHPLEAGMHNTRLDPWSEDSCRDYILSAVERRLDELPAAVVAVLYREAVEGATPSARKHLRMDGSSPAGSLSARKALAAATGTSATASGDADSPARVPAATAGGGVSPSSSVAVLGGGGGASPLLGSLQAPGEIVAWVRQQLRDHVNVVLDRFSVRLMHLLRLIMLCPPGIGSEVDGSTAAEVATKTPEAPREAARPASSGIGPRRRRGEGDDGTAHTAEEAALMPPPVAPVAPPPAPIPAEETTPARQPAPEAANESPVGAPTTATAADDDTVTPAKQMTPAPGSTTEASVQAALGGIPVVSVRKEPLLIALRNVYFDLLRVPFVKAPVANATAAEAAATAASESGTSAADAVKPEGKKKTTEAEPEAAAPKTAIGTRRRGRTETATALAMESRFA